MKEYTRGPYKKTQPDSFIPEFIKLPDGRQIKTADILNKRNGSRNYNLLKNAKFKPRSRVPRQFINPNGRKTKYSLEDRQWQCTATVEEIAKKYNMNTKTARATRSYARNMLNVLQTETEHGVIIDYTKQIVPDSLKTTK